MISKEISDQIRQVQLKTRKLLGGAMLGNGATKSKGAGFDFDQVREYVQGDDLRFVDWKCSARTGKLLTKQYFEDRNYQILIALDVSSSTFLGTSNKVKNTYLREIAAIFSLVAEYCKDQVGLILFSDQIDLQLPIKRGKAHNYRMLEAIFSDFGSRKKAGTNLEQVLKKIVQDLKQKSLVVIISDFIDEHDYSRPLKLLQARHDVIAVRYLDRLEQELPNVGILPIVDVESGEVAMLDTRFAKGQVSMLDLALKNRMKQQNDFLRSCGIDLLQISPESQPVLEVVKFFRKRLIY